MPKIENRKNITELLDQCYCDQENIYIYIFAVMLPVNSVKKQTYLRNN